MLPLGGVTRGGLGGGGRTVNHHGGNICVHFGSEGERIVK